MDTLEKALQTALVASPLTFAKAAIRFGSTGTITEHALTKAIGDYASLTKRDGETREMAFARVFAAQHDVGETFRKAVALAKAQPASSDDTDADTDTDTAMAQLRALVDRMRAAFPELSEAQLFARVYEDPANDALAKRERAENRPVAVW
jgi:hypothetical protein